MGQGGATQTRQGDTATQVGPVTAGKWQFDGTQRVEIVDDKGNVIGTDSGELRVKSCVGCSSESSNVVTVQSVGSMVPVSTLNVHDVTTAAWLPLIPVLLIIFGVFISSILLDILSELRKGGRL